MQIDWKHLATTPGYKSLKAAYIDDVLESERYRHRYDCKPMRDKAEFLKHFNWVINRAKHYAEFTGKPIHIILNEWEANRTYWWLNYYQSCNQPKLFNKCTSVQPRGSRGAIKYCKAEARRYKAPEKASGWIASHLKNERKRGGKKARWPMSKIKTQRIIRMRTPLSVR